MSTAQEFEVRIPSDTADGLAVQNRIIESLESLGYLMADTFRIRLCLEEGIVNAIKHGNAMDPEKSVRISYVADESRLRVEIEDEGEGFSIEDVPDPTLDENLDRPCGRGIMLMRSFMSAIEYRNNGTLLVLEKERTPNEEAADAEDETGDE
jgi:serine/threonine-protein kinase RsbW